MWRLNLLQGYTVAKLAAIIPTGEMLTAIERADAFGPFIDPTSWSRNRDRMNEDRAMLEALHAIAEFGRRLAAEAKAAEHRQARPRAIDTAAAEGC